jgi:methionyl-tRNA formyltransferase
MTIQILCDNPESWIIPYAKQLNTEFLKMRLNSSFIQNQEEVVAGDILILLSCENIFKNLHLNHKNLVVHESDLPKGKGWSPLTWQVIEGAYSIKITLFEASEKVDAGVIYDQESVHFKGTELVEDLRALQAEATLRLLHRFVAQYPNVKGNEQIGESTYYRRRTKEDSKLALDKTLAEQFNLLRVSDNLRYPAWFEVDGEKFELHIFKAK